MKQYIRPLIALAFILMPFNAYAHDGHKDKIEVSDIWARDTLGRTMSGAAYMVIKNLTHTDDKLLGASADIARKVEIHLSSVKDGIMSMQPMHDGIVIPKDGMIQLKPMSYHVMFMGLKQPFKKGSVFPLTLSFEKAGKVTVYVDVRGIDGRK